jgi:hypothetical protein
MDAREERLARNEVVFRDINERVDHSQLAHASGPDVYEFFCECSNLDCTLVIPLTIAVYESVRADPTQFVVAPGHELPEVEQVLERTDTYQVVKKEGEAAEIATEQDPRRPPRPSGS